MAPGRELVNFKADSAAFGTCIVARARNTNAKPPFGAFEVHNVTFGLKAGAEGDSGLWKQAAQAEQALFKLIFCVVVKFCEVNKGVLGKFALHAKGGTVLGFQKSELVHMPVHEKA